MLLNPTLPEFKAALQAATPELVYLCGPTNFEQAPSTGTVGAIQFSGAPAYAHMPGKVP